MTTTVRVDQQTMRSFVSGCLSLCGQVTQSGRRYRWQISFWCPSAMKPPRMSAYTLYC